MHLLLLSYMSIYICLFYKNAIKSMQDNLLSNHIIENKYKIFLKNRTLIT